MQKFIGKMARMYPLLILMGFMMVVIAFIVGYFNSQTAAAYFAAAKPVRETTLLAERASFESRHFSSAINSGESFQQTLADGQLHDKIGYGREDAAEDAEVAVGRVGVPFPLVVG